MEPVIEPRIAEVPGPPTDVMPRAEWIRRSLLVDWTEFIELGGSLLKGHDSVMTNWRAGVLDAAFACPHDAVVFSHFVPVNVLTGHATGSDRVACFLPDHTSITVFEITDHHIRLVEKGREKQRTTVHPGK
jgi:broad specificity phosphatase PhoE